MLHQIQMDVIFSFLFSANRIGTIGEKTGAFTVAPATSYPDQLRAKYFHFLLSKGRI
jgi:hypothetical protein